MTEPQNKKTLEGIIQSVNMINDPNFMSFSVLQKTLLEKDQVGITRQTLDTYKKNFETTFKIYGKDWYKFIKPPYIINFNKFLSPNVEGVVMHYLQVKDTLIKYYLNPGKKLGRPAKYGKKTDLPKKYISKKIK